MPFLSLKFSISYNSLRELAISSMLSEYHIKVGFIPLKTMPFYLSVVLEMTSGYSENKSGESNCPWLRALQIFTAFNQKLSTLTKCCFNVSYNL